MPRTSGINVIESNRPPWLCKLLMNTMCKSSCHSWRKFNATVPFPFVFDRGGGGGGGGGGGVSKLGGRQFHTVSSCRWIICGNCPFVKATATATIQPLLRQVLPCETATFYNTFSSNEDTQVLLVLVPTWPWEDIGGQGGLTRLYGLAIDTLRSVRIVLATPADHAVLFWALRGAGQQNFGVVTQLEYTYYPTQDDAFIVAAGEVPVHLVPYFLSSLGRDEPP